MIICSDTHAMLSAVRKQWVKATRYLQSLRASTLNAEEILRLTHHIMHMQQMKFIAKPPEDQRGAAVYFVPPDQLENPPAACASLYVTDLCNDKQLLDLVAGLSANAMVVAYTNSSALHNLKPKRELEDTITQQWQQMQDFFAACHIQVKDLAASTNFQSPAIDDAMDTLLTRSSDFLHHAAALQHALGLAQPLHAFSHKQQRQFEVVIRLAHRVQALSPGSFNSYLLRVFGDSEATSYFLRDGIFDD